MNFKKFKHHSTAGFACKANPMHQNFVLSDSHMTLWKYAILPSISFIIIVNSNIVTIVGKIS